MIQEGFSKAAEQLQAGISTGDLAQWHVTYRHLMSDLDNLLKRHAESIVYTQQRDLSMLPQKDQARILASIPKRTRDLNIINTAKALIDQLLEEYGEAINFIHQLWSSYNDLKRRYEYNTYAAQSWHDLYMGEIKNSEEFTNLFLQSLLTIRNLKQELNNRGNANS